MQSVDIPPEQGILGRLGLLTLDAGIARDAPKRLGSATGSTSTRTALGDSKHMTDNRRNQDVLLGHPTRPRLRPSSPPNSAVALVDFDNWHEAAGSRPVESTLREVVQAVTSRLFEIEPAIAAISIRLYGGWTQMGAFSQTASEVATHLPVVDPFPIPAAGRIVRGEVRLATTLASDPTIDIGDLCRIRSGPPRLRLASSPRPNGCANETACSAKALQRFTSKGTSQCPTEGCTVVASDAFSTKQQKMVDTLMTCDLLTYASSQEVLAVSVVTADTDLMPPLLQALAFGQTKVLLQTNLPYWPLSQLKILRKCGIVYFGPREDRSR